MQAAVDRSTAEAWDLGCGLVAKTDTKEMSRSEDLSTLPIDRGACFIHRPHLKGEVDAIVLRASEY